MHDFLNYENIFGTINKLDLQKRTHADDDLQRAGAQSKLGNFFGAYLSGDSFFVFAIKTISLLINYGWKVGTEDYKEKLLRSCAKTKP